MRWDAARVASHRPLPKPHKMHDRVAEQPTRIVGDPSDPNGASWTGPANGYPDVGCSRCGFLHCARIPGKCPDAQPHGVPPMSTTLAQGFFIELDFAATEPPRNYVYTGPAPEAPEAPDCPCIFCAYVRDKERYVNDGSEHR